MPRRTGQTNLRWPRERVYDEARYSRRSEGCNESKALAYPGPGPAVSVEDNNVCTTDSCNPSTGPRHDPIAMSDGIDCTEDACDPSTGVFHTPVNARCEKDGFSCTQAVCNPSTGCSESPDNARCSDGASCTTDTCVGAGGANNRNDFRVCLNASPGQANSVTDTLRSGSGTAAATQAFTYTGVLNGSANPLQADSCTLQLPGSFTVTANTATPLIYGRILEYGLTEATGAPSGVLAQVGYGPSSSNPTTATTWRYFDAVYTTQVGNDDEYQASFIAPATLGTYAYTYRFSLDNGLNWTYCDQDGAGSNPGLGFSTAQLGSMTVN